MGRFQVFVAAVVAAGLAVLASACWGLARPGEAAALSVVALFLLLGELLPLRGPATGAAAGLSTSAAFTFALLLRWGLPAAVLAQAAATLLADLVSRRRRARRWWQSAFDIGQQTLAWTAAAGVLAAGDRLGSLAAPRDLSGGLAVIAAAGVAYLLVNNVAVCAALALRRGTPLAAELRAEFGYWALTTGALLSLAPLVALAAGSSAAYVLLLVLPLAVVHRGASASREAEHRALHDPLTGLPNRALLLDRAAQVLAEAGRTGARTGFLLLDLDGFKAVNDTLGHQAGDRLLQQLAGRLAHAVRPGDTLARLGGDEFAVLLPGVDGVADARAVAERLLHRLGEPVTTAGRSVALRASLGLACHPRHAADLDALVRAADTAMYAAKRRGGGIRVAADREPADREPADREPAGRGGTGRRLAAHPPESQGVPPAWPTSPVPR